MQIKTFALPLFDAEQVEADLNRFLRSHRILQMERHFSAENGGCWAILVEYMEGDSTSEAAPAHRREKKDYGSELDAAALSRYEYFKQVRRELAKQRSLPAYLIFTNEELAILARVDELTEETARQVKGIAPSRMKDYVKYFYAVSDGEESGQPDGADSRQGEPA